MKFTLRPESRAEDDLFSPLRELRSPISMEKIRSLVLARASGNFSFWSQVRGLIGQWIALGVISTIVINFSGIRGGAVGGHEIPIMSKSAAATSVAVATSTVAGTSVTVARSSEFSNPGSYMNRQVNTNPLHPTIFNTIRTSKPSNIPSSESIATLSPITHLQGEEGIPILPQNNKINDLVQQVSINPNPPTGVEWYSTLSSGAVFSNIRMLGESAEIGIQSGWESIGLAFTNASGNHDMHDILEHRTTTSSLLYSESDQTLALLIGANYSIGPVAVKAELGPAYLISSSKFIDPVTEALGSSIVNNKIGMAAEISAFYHVNDFFQAGVTGISSYRTGQFANGILVSITIRP